MRSTTKMSNGRTIREPTMHELDQWCSWKVTGLLGSSEEVLARLFVLRLFGLRCFICLARILAYLFQTDFQTSLCSAVSDLCELRLHVHLNLWLIHFGSSLWDSNPKGFSSFHLGPTIHLFWIYSRRQNYSKNETGKLLVYRIVPKWSYTVLEV